jgi:hypothetical protein
MGLRSSVTKRVKGVVARLSGEYSAAAPEEIEPFARNLGEDAARKIVRAQLHRPKGSGPAAADDEPQD